ncbi:MULTISPECIES: hypothetical protein, partial [unclassified Bacillus (in: firmicutes)]|uniref:OmpL47-type beta-barrel domain-containing protein n=1 Tax=unclassified Bacillus (in: firmicutes) TaxID=185979 RepID=UPI0008E552AD
MKKRNISLLMVILLFLQLLSPIGETFAAESGVILPPSNLAFTKITPDDGKLTWNSVYEATSYNIYGITEGQLALLGNSKSNNFNLPDLPEGKYNYVVSSLKDNFESGPTAPVEVEIIYPEMLAPTPLSYSIQNGNDIVLNWGESKYAENYNVYSVSASGQKTLIKTTNLRAFSITNVAEGSYSYAVSAANSLYGESVLSATVTANLEYPVMKEPNTASFSISNGSDVTLNWQATSFATGYKIYQVIDGEEILQNTVTAATTVKYSNKSPGDYTYRIYSYSDRFGQSLSGKEIRLTVSSITMVPPSNLSNKIQNTNDVFLSWNQVPYATGYKIYQISNGEKTLKSTVTGTTLTLTNVPGGDYIYEVHSYSDRFGESEAGSQTMFTMNTITMLPPANVSYKIQNGNDIVLSWDAAQNITDYKIYQIVNGQKILKNTVYGTSVTFANMPAGEYIYEVYSNSTKFGASTEGRTISFSLVHPQMNPPVNVIQTINSATSFTLKWDASEYATSYKVYQVINGQKTLKSTVSNPNVSFSNMAPGNYTYEIYASSSKFGDSKTGSLIDVVLNGQVMEAPSNFAFAIKNGNDISLSWNSVPYANSYKVYKLVDGKPVLQSIVYGTNVTYTNQPEGNFTYLVYSVSTLLGESPEGSEIQVNLTHPKMEKPNDLTSKIQNGNDVALTWATVPFANEYKIYELIDGQEIIKATSSTTNKIITNVSEGNHIYIVRSFNARFGQSVEGSQVSTNVVYPIMQTPDNLTKSIVSGNDIRLSWNTVPFATSYKIYQIIDNQRVLKMTVSTPYHVFTNMPEGDYSFEVYSYSDRFGESLKGNAMSHTLVFPVMQAPKNLAQSIFNGNDIQLRWDASTYATGYKIYQVKDGIREFVRTVTGTSNTFVNMPEGNYLYEVHSYSDRFGESPESSKMSLNLTWPVVQPPVLQGAVVNANNIQLTWKAVTWANEYRVYKVSGETKELVYKGTALNFTAYNLSEDTHSYVVTAMSSRFGESQISNLYKETIVYPEMEAPVASLKLLSETSARISWNFVTYANGYNVFEIIDGKPVLIAGKVNNLSYTLQNLSYANHEYYITSYSNSFGESKPSEKVLAKLILDTLPPVTNTDAESQWTTGSQIINLTATDDETGVAKTLYSVNDGSFVEGSTFTIDQEGVNKLSFYSIDKVGNKEDVKTVNVKIDKTLPVTTAELPDGWEVEDFTVVLNATDAQSGVAKTFYSLNGTEFTEGTTLSVNEEGVNSVSFYS